MSADHSNTFPWSRHTAVPISSAHPPPPAAPATHSIARCRPLPGCTTAAPACPVTVCRPWPARTRSWRWGRGWGCGLGRRRTTRSEQQRGMQPVINSGPPDREKMDLESGRKRATFDIMLFTTEQTAKDSRQQPHKRHRRTEARVRFLVACMAAPSVNFLTD